MENFQEQRGNGRLSFSYKSSRLATLRCYVGRVISASQQSPKSKAKITEWDLLTQLSDK